MRTITIALTTITLCISARPDDGKLADYAKRLSSDDYETRKSVVTELLHAGQKQALGQEEISLLLPHLKSDQDWRIKVRITAVLPFAQKPEWVLQPLIAALQDREEEKSGGGYVPLYACGALAQLGDASALNPMEAWLQFLESNPKAYPHTREKLIKSTKRHIAELKSKLENKKR